MALKWLTNSNDPRKPGYEQTIVRVHNVPWERQLQADRDYRKDKVIGEPKATSTYTVEQLKKKGMVGLYETTKEDTP